MASTFTTGASGAIRSGIEVRRDHLTIGVLSVDGTALLRLEGELDAATAPALLDVGRSLVEAGSRDVVLDCGRLRFCDSAGLQAFTSIRRAPGVETVTLVRTSPVLRQLLAITCLEPLFLFDRTGGV